MTVARKMPSLEVPAWLPARATLVLTRVDEPSDRGEARIDGRLVAQLAWSRQGRLLHEKRFDAQGRGHGIETQRDDAGRVIWCAQWVRGAMHGSVIQFDEQQRPILATHFVRGRGVDIWANCGKVTEVREMADGAPHGLVRWGDPRKPWEESHFRHGQRHGILRRWLENGTLKKGYPHYFVRDERVSRRAYDVARSKDDSLPEYRADDDSNRRRLPAVVRDALARAKQLRNDLALIDHARSAQTIVRAVPLP